MASPTFQSARVCVLLRQKRPLPEGETRGELIYDYEVLAWPPGTTDGGLLPQAADVITLPGHDRAFIVMERAIHWPAPTSPEGRRGEVQVNLGVEPVEQDLDPLTRSPFGRPGEAQIRAEGRWLEGAVAGFQVRDSRKRDENGRPHHRFMSIAFDIPGVGRLSHFVAYACQVREMFGPEAERDLPDHEYADFGTLAMVLRERTRFEVNVAPDSADRLSIRAVRPLREPEPGEEPNTWDQQAQELTDEIHGEL